MEGLWILIAQFFAVNGRVGVLICTTLMPINEPIRVRIAILTALAAARGAWSFTTCTISFVATHRGDAILAI